MVPVLVPNEKLSPFSVGALEDIGYTVDYNAASSYNYNDLGGSCKCKRRRTLFGQEVEDEEENMMSVHQPQAPAPRKLTQDEEDYANEKAKEFMQRSKESQTRSAGGIKDDDFAGCDGMRVYMEKAGEIHSVHIPFPCDL